MKNKSILLIDDDRDIRDVITVALEGEGYQIHTAENGLMGLNWLNEHRTNLPALIILDLMMPGMDGRAFLSELQKFDFPKVKEVPIFLSSATSNLAVEGLPIAGVLTKPMELQSLIDLANKYCGTTQL